MAMILTPRSHYNTITKPPTRFLYSLLEVGLSTSRAGRVFAQPATDLLHFEWAIFQPAIDPLQ